MRWALRHPCCTISFLFFVSKMNNSKDLKKRPAQMGQSKAEDLSLRGYYSIGTLSVIIGIGVVSLLNLATPHFLSDRLAYFSQQIGISTGLKFYLLLFVTPIPGLLLIYACFRIMLRIILGPISKYLNLLKANQVVPDDLIIKAGRRLLNIPFIYIPANLGMWIVIPAVLCSLAYFTDQMTLQMAVTIATRASMVGLISSFVASHRMEAFSRRKLIPFFFPDGQLVDMKGIYRLSISQRIQLLNRLGSAVPAIIFLLTLLTLQWEVNTFQISPVEYGWIMIRFFFILFVLFMIMTHVLNKVGSRNITEPLKEIIRVLKLTRKGQFDQKVRVVSNDEIGYTGDVINEMNIGLQERDSMKRSLELAEEVQQNLLPKENPQIAGLDIAGKSIYCDQTGGDYYDFIEIGKNGRNKLAVVVGDVSDHGVSSALLMASARAYLRQRTSLPGTLSHIISDVNQQIVLDVEETGQFMSLFYMLFDQDNQCFQWVRAGHDPGIFYDPNEDMFEELAGKGVALGISTESNYQTYRKEALQSGQIIVLGTDGIWEARNPDGDMFGKDSIYKLIRENAGVESGDLLARILDALDQFRDGADLHDDITMIVIKIETGEAKAGRK